MQIKQSEGNLAAQYASLASQQNAGMQKALDQMRQDRVRVMAANLHMDLDVMDQVSVHNEEYIRGWSGRSHSDVQDFVVTRLFQ